MRIIGIDFGERRIGVAAADDRTRIAIPLDTVDAGVDPVAEIARVLAEQNADEVVIGLPLSLSGAEGPQAERVREAIAQLEQRISIPIRTYDERLTTTQASRVPVASGRSSGKRKGRAHDNSDSIAASILLQAYLDSKRPYD